MDFLKEALPIAAAVVAILGTILSGVWGFAKVAIPFWRRKKEREKIQGIANLGIHPPDLDDRE